MLSSLSQESADQVAIAAILTNSSRDSQQPIVLDNSELWEPLPDAEFGKWVIPTGVAGGQ